MESAFAKFHWRTLAKINQKLYISKSARKKYFSTAGKDVNRGQKKAMCQNSDTPPGDMKRNIQSETDLAHRAAAAFDYDGTGSRIRHPTSGNVEVFGASPGVIGLDLPDASQSAGSPQDKR